MAEGSRPGAQAPKASASDVSRGHAPSGGSAGGGASSLHGGISKSLVTRVASGAVYAVLFIGSLMLGTVTSAAFVALLSGLCCYEFLNMMRIDGKMPNIAIGVGAAVLFPIAALGEGPVITALVFALVLLCGLWYVYSPRIRITDVAITIMGPIYTGLMLSSIVLLRDGLPNFPGAVASVCVCASLWVSDSFAYLVGRRFGRHKMAPKISPKKSWEGFFGGLAGSALVWWVLWLTHVTSLTLPYAVLCGVVVAVLGVFGDLIESRIKRGVGVKDSGNLMPGHGGMLDRCDSLIFGCITAQLMLIIGGVL